jgi:hypothetical protein
VHDLLDEKGMFMSGDRTGRLGFTVCAAAFVGGGVLLAGTAEAAPVAQSAAMERHLVRGDDDGKQKVIGNKAKVTGGHNAVSANSPTKNKGFQHNSGSNVARQISFQYGLCKLVKNCKISQRFISKRRFVGFSGPPLKRRERVAHDSDFRFFFDDTRATTMLNPSMTSLNVKNP